MKYTTINLILRDLDMGKRQKDIAKKYCCTQSTISNINKANNLLNECRGDLIELNLRDTVEKFTPRFKKSVIDIQNARAIDFMVNGVQAGIRKPLAHKTFWDGFVEELKKFINKWIK